jgi:uncharacterized peroxidase-related enzyme
MITESPATQAWKSMAFIRMIGPAEAKGGLATRYRRIAGDDGQVDNVLQIHSLRPHTLDGHMALYKAALHHPRNRLPVWFLEAIGVLVSRLNECSYCDQHHTAGMQRLLEAEPGRFAALNAALDREDLGEPFTAAQQAALRYARQLTLSPGTISAGDIDTLREQGFSDGEILELNQVAAYFSYANRTVTGLGVNTENETLGLSPGNTGDGDWAHG